VPEMTLNRNHVLRTTRGHTIAFAKGIPTYVPDVVVGDAVAVGALLVKGEYQPEDLTKQTNLNLGPQDPAERKKAIFKAFDVLSKALIRDDFTAAGTPTKYAVDRVTGFSVEARERDRLWGEFKTAKGEGDD